jgi:5-methylcytosine-specific restriction endonuclease McrA
VRDPNCEWRYFADVKGVCDNCGVRLPKYRRNWCSDECAVEYVINHQWAAAKREVWRRDGGACVLCGVLVLAEWTTERSHPDYPVRAPGDLWGHTEALMAFRKAQWDEYGEVDHIVPCRSYNAGCQHHLTNLRLLCRRCHRERTVNYRRSQIVR